VTEGSKTIATVESPVVGTVYRFLPG
jgi:hypothetical protein